MGYFKRVVLYIIVMVVSVFIMGCDSSSDTSEKPKEDSKEEPIKKSFAKTLDMYPIKNLEDLYDKEGYRDGEFKRATKECGLYIQILLKAINQTNWMMKVWF